MAKKKVTTHKFYVVDLVRKKPATKYIVIPAYRVDVQIDVTTTGILSASEVPSAALKRLEDAARGALDNYETVIASEAEKLDAKIGDMLESPDKKVVAEAEKLIQGVNKSIENALKSAEGAALKAAEDRLKKEIQADKNLKESQIRLAIKVTAAAITVATNVATLVASMGADVTAYYSLAKVVYAMGTELNQQLKNEEKLRKDLDTAIRKFIDLRGNTIMQAAKRQMVDTSGLDPSHPIDSIKVILGKIKAGGDEIMKGRDLKGIMTEVTDFVIKGIKSQSADVEKARTAYRDHTTKTRKKVDNLSGEADKLAKAMKAATTLKDGVKIGAQVMGLKRGVTELGKKLDEREKYLDSMQELMKGNGLTVDDKTTWQKLKELDKMTAAETVKEVYEFASGIYDLVGALT